MIRDLHYWELHLGGFSPLVGPIHTAVGLFCLECEHRLMIVAKKLSRLARSSLKVLRDNARQSCGSTPGTWPAVIFEGIALDLDADV